MEDIEIAFEHATAVRRVQWMGRKGQMRVCLQALGRVPSWYDYTDVPLSVFDGLKAQIQGALRQRTGQPKGHKRFSVGTYYHAQIEHKYGHRRVDGPLP